MECRLNTINEIDKRKKELQETIIERTKLYELYCEPFSNGTIGDIIFKYYFINISDYDWIYITNYIVTDSLVKIETDDDSIEIYYSSENIYRCYLSSITERELRAIWVYYIKEYSCDVSIYDFIDWFCIRYNTYNHIISNLCCDVKLFPFKCVTYNGCENMILNELKLLIKDNNI